MKALVLACVLVSLSIGCSDESGTAAAATSGSPGGCKPGEWQRDDGMCVAAGLPPDMPCPPGEWLRETDATCIPAGVPPDGCGTGFVHDGDRGCEPILPPDPCPAGLMAVPGDRECHEIAPCGSGTWGDIPIEPDTEYVDQSYAGGDSDGSAQKPWTTIGDGVTAAATGAIVAIAAGSYVEAALIQGKPVRLWGRCPALVEIVGMGGAFAAIDIRGGASGTELRSIAVRGATCGVALTAAQDVVVDRTWVHDNASYGVAAQDDLGQPSITIRSSLLEQNQLSSVFTSGSTAIVEASVVRGKPIGAPGFTGRGVNIQAGKQERPSTVTLRGSLLERNQGVALHVSDSAVVVDATVVRTTVSDAAGLLGSAVYVQGTTTPPTSLTVRASFLDQNRYVGIGASGSSLLVESTVVRNTLFDLQGGAGRGVNIDSDTETGTPSNATVRASLIEGSHDFGLVVAGSEVLVEATVVRDTLPDGTSTSGRGVAVAKYPGEPPAKLTLRASIIDATAWAGLGIADSTAVVEGSVIGRSSADAYGELGDGIVAVSVNSPSSVAINATRIEQSSRAAVSTFGASVTISQSELVCQTFDLFGATYSAFPFTLDDLGGTLCGCPYATKSCVAKGEGLEPPPPIGGLE